MIRESSIGGNHYPFLVVMAGTVPPNPLNFSHAPVVIKEEGAKTVPIVSAIV